MKGLSEELNLGLKAAPNQEIYYNALILGYTILSSLFTKYGLIKMIFLFSSNQGSEIIIILDFLREKIKNFHNSIGSSFYM